MKEGWEIKKLSDVLKIQNGYAFDAKLFTIEKGVPLIRIRDIKEGVGTVTNFNGKYDKKYEVNAGDFLIGMDGEFGCYEWKGDTALLNQRVCRLQEFSDKLYPRFLFYGINKYLKAIEDVTAFATVKHISSKQIENIEIPLPPLPEQKRIVAILDEAFAAIDKAKANAEQNLKNAKELFESYLQSVFENKSERWELRYIDEVCTEIFAGGDAPKNNFSLNKSENHAIPIYANSVKKRGLYGYTDFARVTEPSITIAARGSGTGHTEIRREKYFPIVRLIVLIPNTELVTLEFLKYKIDTLDILRSGSAIPQLTVPMIKGYKIPLVSPEKQVIIVQNLNQLNAEIKKLEAIYQQKINDLEELKKSVLQKAFAGELQTAKELA